MGTGRLALPLAERGLAVTGVDASAAMLERLAAKPGAERLRLVRGDMADLDATDLDRPRRPVDGVRAARSGVVLIAYNTLFNLADDAAQARCLAGAAARLAPGGRLVIETFVPADPADHDDAGRVRARRGPVGEPGHRRGGGAQRHRPRRRSPDRGRPAHPDHRVGHPPATVADPLPAPRPARRAGRARPVWCRSNGGATGTATPFDDDSPTLISVYGS